MTKSTKRVTLTLAVLVVAIAAAIPTLRERGRIMRCQSNQHCFPCAFIMYAQDHNGAFPPNVQELRAYADCPSLLICPSSGNRAPADLRNVTNWLDYIYVYWPAGTNMRGEYPLLFDRRLSYHGGKGVNVTFVDGSTIWDEKANHLREFARKHPELGIPLPEDLK